MILVTPDIKKKYPKAFRAARKERFRVVFLEPNLAYVARRRKGHGRYLVKLTAVASIDGGQRVGMSCREINGGPCQGYQWKGFCSHLAVVILRSEAKPEKKEQRAA